MYIIISLIVIIIIVIIAYVSSKKMTENYIAPTSIPPNYEKYNTQLTHISNDPSGEPLAFDSKNNFNYTQLYYAFLIQFFKALSFQKKNYEKKLVKDVAKNTIDYHDMDNLNILVKPLLKKMKEIAPETDFWLVGYESWRIYQVNDSPLKINQIECFVYDRINWTEVKLLMEICELPKKKFIGRYDCSFAGDKKLKTIAELTTPEFPTYHVGIPSQDQLIPLPTEVVPTGDQVLNNNGIDFPIPCPYERIWVNWIEVVNSSLVLNAYEEFEDKHIKGFDNPILDYTVWKSKNNSPYQDPNYVTNQWPTLNTQPKDINAYPCAVHPYTWNSQGVQNPETKPQESRKCPGIRKGLKQEPLTASYDPSMFNYPRGITSYKWMFDLAKNDMGLSYEGW